MKDLVLTDHAVERMVVRRIPRGLVRAAIDAPDQRKAEDDGDTQFIKEVSGRQVHVVAKPLPDRGKGVWLIKTVWVRGEDDPNPLVKGILTFAVRIFREALVK